MSTKTQKGCVKIVAALLLWPISYTLHGLALVQLWLWFILPTFHVPAPSTAMAVGLWFTVKFLVPDAQVPEDNAERTDADWFIKLVVKTVIAPMLAVILGRIIYAFVGGAQ